MISNNGFMVNGKLKVNGKTQAASCRVNDKKVEVMATNLTIANNIYSDHLVSAAQVVAYISGLRS